MADEPLSDEQVYDLMHQALLLLMNRKAKTDHGADVLSVSIKQIQLLQHALLIFSEKQKPDC